MAPIKVLSDDLAHEEIRMKLGDLDELLLELIKQKATALGITTDFSFFDAIVDDTSPEASLLVIRRKMKKQIRVLALQIDAFQNNLAVLKSRVTQLLEFEMRQGKSTQMKALKAA